jgi:hypothetical protein
MAKVGSWDITFTNMLILSSGTDARVKLPILRPRVERPLKGASHSPLSNTRQDALTS